MKDEEEEAIDNSSLNTKRKLKKNYLITSKKKKEKKPKKEKEKTKKGKKEKKESKVKENKNDSKEIAELKQCYEFREDPEECISHLQSYYNSLNIIDLENIFTKKNIKYFENMNPKENVQIDLLLNKIYEKIFSSEDFYKNYFSDEDENETRVSLVLSLLEESIHIIDNFSDYFISLENFRLKENILRLIKFIYINLKESISKEEEQYLRELIDDLSHSFYSDNYLELIKYKNIIYKNNNELLKNIEDIDNLFFELGSYYEQLNSIQLLLNDIESVNDKENMNNYSSVTIHDIKKSKKNKKKKFKKESSSSEDDEKKSVSKKNNLIEYDDEDILIYGQFLLKLCIYQKYHLKIDNSIKKNGNKKNRNEESDENEEEEEEEEKEEVEKTKKKQKIKKNVKNKKNKNDEIEENEEEDIDEESEDPNNILCLFVIDAVKTVNGRIQNKSNENIEIEELLNDKKCISLNERENLFEIIKKNVDNFNNITKKSKSKKIKNLKDKLNLYIKAINEDKYIPIYIDKLNNIKYYNNFSKNTISVPNRDSKIFYIENNEDKKGLLFIDFYVNDENKDIIFKIRRYDPESDNFNQVHDTGKTNKRCKLVIYFEEKSLYQLEFDNTYSWLNPKEINFSVSILRIIDGDDLKNINKENNLINNNEIQNENIINENNNNINNENIDTNINNNNIEKNLDKDKDKDKEHKEFKVSDAILNNRKIIKFYCNNEEQNYTFNCNKIYKKLKQYQELEKNDLTKKDNIIITLIVYLNQIRIISLDNNEKIIYTEILEEKEKLLTKNFFNKTIINYIKENIKLEDNNKKILINLYSQNKNLSLISNKIKELISALKDYSINNVDEKQNRIYSHFLQKIGFYPDKKMGDFEIMYNLYDFSDQCLIYHLFLVHCQEKFVESSTLVMIFDKDNLHITALNEGGIYTKFKSLENGWKRKYYSKIKMDDFKSIVEFISAVSDSFDGLDLVLCYMNNEDKKDELLALFKQIKEYTAEKIDEPINVYIYQEEDFIRKILKYIWLFSEV